MIDAANTFNAPAPQIDTSPLGFPVTNRVYSPSENISLPCASPQSTSRLMCYDAAGNLIRDKHVTNAAWMKYDADGKMRERNTNDIQGDTAFTFYDSDGKRRRFYSGNGNASIFVYGLTGELLYDAGKAFGTRENVYRNGDHLASATVPRAGQSSDVRWLVKDHLGTPRMIADQTGSLSAIQRHDYLPFGEEIGVGVGGRDVSQGYGPPQSDGIRQQFTGYERDMESGLDYAQARYFGSSLGRFTAVDPLTASASPGSPQSWNRYSYVENKPLRMVDPTGMIGDYYYEDGRYIGSDRKSDGRKYTATVDKRDITPDGEIIYVSNVREQRSVEAMAIQALSRSLGATADAAIFGKLKGAANFAINNTFPGAARLLPNVSYDNEAEASHGAATQTGLGLGTAFATGVLAGGAAAAPLSVVPEVVPASAASTLSVVPETTAAVHGNSLASLRPTWGYRLFSNDGQFLKNGITSQPIAEARYTKAFMADKYLEKIPFPNRLAARTWERHQFDINRGPMNLRR